MSGFLIDTNVISEFAKPEPNRHVKLWFQTADPNSLFVSVITFGEIRLGIENMPIGRRRTDLERWVNEGLPEWFESNLLSVTKPIADRWAQITVQAKTRGSALATTDGLIAATALERGLTLVTRNVKDFEGLGNSIFNPWQ